MFQIYGENLLNYINSILIDLKYILSFHGEQGDCFSRDSQRITQKWPHTQIKFKSLNFILKNDIKYIETDKSWTFVYEIGHCRYIHWRHVLRTRGRRVMTFVSSGFLGLAMSLNNSTIYQSDPIHTEAPTIFYLTPAIQKFIIIIIKWSNIVM